MKKKMVALTLYDTSDIGEPIYRGTNVKIKCSKNAYRERGRADRIELSCPVCSKVLIDESEENRYPREWYICPECRNRIQTAENLLSINNKDGFFRKIGVILNAFGKSVLIMWFLLFVSLFVYPFLEEHFDEEKSVKVLLFSLLVIWIFVIYKLIKRSFN